MLIITIHYAMKYGWSFLRERWTFRKENFPITTILHCDIHNIQNGLAWCIQTLKIAVLEKNIIIVHFGFFYLLHKMKTFHFIFFLLERIDIFDMLLVFYPSWLLISSTFPVGYWSQTWKWRRSKGEKNSPCFSLSHFDWTI